jgi:hypothetical protein
MDLSVAKLFNVENKICLVTGGGSGIGKSTPPSLVSPGIPLPFFASPTIYWQRLIAEK